jgi:hypothetical protein
MRTGDGLWAPQDLVALRLAALRREGQLWPSKRLVTEPSLNTSLIARAFSGAMDSTVSV